MADVASWAARSKTPIPAVGRYAEQWHETPGHAGQFEPGLNGGFELTQLPPGGTFEIRWRCASGHQWFMTPKERRTAATWKRGDLAACPLCNGHRHMRNSTLTYGCGHSEDHRAPDDTRVPGRCLMCQVIESMGTTREALAENLHEGHQPKVLSEHRLTIRRQLASDSNPYSRYSWTCPDVAGHRHFARSVAELADGRGCPVCWTERQSDALGIEPGTAFSRAELNLPSSRAERELLALLSERVRVDTESQAVRVASRFWGRLEVWPDVLITGLRVAVEYDTAGKRHNEHLGPGEESDRAKDQVLREVGWEVIRVRVKPLQPLGPYDIEAAGVSQKLANAIVARLRDIRGDAAVDAELV